MPKLFASEEIKCDCTVETAKRRILLPIDSSEHSQRAFEWYTDNLWRPGDALLMLHIIDSDGSNQHSNQIELLLSSDKKLCQKYVEMCKSKSVSGSFTTQVGKDPGEQIITRSKDDKVVFIVIGNRGMGAVKRTFLGSVSDHVLHNANLPVVVVPPKKSGTSKK